MPLVYGLIGVILFFLISIPILICYVKNYAIKGATRKTKEHFRARARSHRKSKEKDIEMPPSLEVKSSKLKKLLPLVANSPIPLSTINNAHESLSLSPKVTPRVTLQKKCAQF